MSTLNVIGFCFRRLILERDYILFARPFRGLPAPEKIQAPPASGVRIVEGGGGGKGSAFS